MTKRMLIDATHAEETRVVVLDGTRLEDFDVETSAKRHLKGNIYLAKVVRVEPSLQAAFVEYGGNRHGFLAFSEIHPDYYQIPIADRQRLLDMEAEEARREEEEDELQLALSEPPPPPPPRVAEPTRQGRFRRDRRFGRNRQHGTSDNGTETAIERAQAAEAWAHANTPPLIVPPRRSASAVIEPEAWARAAAPSMTASDARTSTEAFTPVSLEWALSDTPPLIRETTAELARSADSDAIPTQAADAEAWALPGTPALITQGPSGQTESDWPDEFAALEPSEAASAPMSDDDDDDMRGMDPDDEDDGPPPETLGGDPDTGDDREERRLPSRFMRNYKIQEVIRRRQIMLVQVVKEERGTKGAALTTYLSLAGRFSVLMPNSPRGGGISRKITSAADRRRLKEVMVELDIPRGMGLIIRTAGAARPKPEIKRDCEYLLRLWDDIRDHTLKSIAPALIYEEASLIKRAIRDVYSRDIDEIQVDGTEGWRAAHEFMRMLMPTHARKVQLWDERGQPLFARYQVESQLDAMLNPIVQLRSGGYLVINQAEALVAIDVNSGRSTRERNVEETALRTNLEAADEVARQLRLRDLAGLIVIDFIDMESRRHNAMVERRLKDALRNDRARIQVGHISHFGLLEMSRQRLRPSLTETSFITCPHCGGMGHVRTTESAAIHVLRGVEDEASKRRAAEAIVHVATPIALYLLNHKRERLQEIEHRYGMRVIIAADDSQLSPRYRIERIRAQIAGEAPQFVTPDLPPSLPARVDEPPEEDEVDETDEAAAAAPAEQVEIAGSPPEEAEASSIATNDVDELERHRRRRRRRRGRREDGTEGELSDRAESSEEADAQVTEEPVAPVVSAPVVAVPDDAETDEEGRARRRGRRGGRRRRRDGGEEIPDIGLPGADQPDLSPVYTGPTPADPFGGQPFDIFDVMDQVETAAAARMTQPASPPAAKPVASEDWARSAFPPLVETSPTRKPVLHESLAREPQSWASAAHPALVGASDAGGAAADSVVAKDQSAAAPKSVAPARTVRVQATERPIVAEAPAAPSPDATPTSGEAPAAEPVTGESLGLERPTVESAIPANDTGAVAGPVIKPVVIGRDATAPAERKRGWWRRV